MALIPRDKYTTPQDYASVSGNAESDARLAAAYALLAEASNCGRTCVLFQQELTSEEIAKLSSRGITATKNPHCVYPGRQWILQGK